MAEQFSAVPMAASRRDRPHPADWASAAIVILATLFVAHLSGERHLAGYGTETDYLGSTVAEARRLLAGEPLQSDFHPPGFIFVVAGAFLLLGDWFAAGKAVAGMSAVAVLVSTHLLFRILGGPWLALGSVVGLASSATFLKYAVQATSDIYFLALYCVVFLLTAVAIVREWSRGWAAIGALVVLAMMTRTNGITLLLFLAAPLVLAGRTRKLSALGSMAGGIVAIALLFWLFALVTGSDLKPDGTYHNIALTYFTAERITWEGMVEARQRFDSLADVILYDPAAMAVGYAKDLVNISLRRIPGLAGPVLALLFLPGLILALADRSRALLAAFLAVTLAQLLLVNLKAYEPRYHLYLTPWIGAGGVATILFFATRAEWRPILRAPVAGALTALVLLGTALAWTDARGFAATGGNPELARALPAVEGLVGTGDMVVARKRHLAFYTGAGSMLLPSVATLAELRAVLDTAADDADPGGAVYLFLGEVERHFRPGLAGMIAGAEPVPWLAPVAAGAGSGDWTLYSYRPGTP